MKNLNLLNLIFFILSTQLTFAQPESHLTISDDYPKPGEKLTFTYDPVGTNLEKKTDISAIVYYLDNKDFPAFDLDLKPVGHKFSFETVVPTNAKAFFIRISSADSVDNNNGKGYFYYIYNDKSPVIGAYAEKAYYISSYKVPSYAKINRNVNAGIVLYQQEFKLHPQVKKRFEYNYYSLLNRTHEYSKILEKALDSLGKTNNEDDLYYAWSYYFHQLNKYKEADSLHAKLITNYPNGIIATIKKLGNFRSEQNLAKKDSLYNFEIKNIPEKYDASLGLYITQDLFLQWLSDAYRKNRDFDNFYKYADLIKDKNLKAKTFNDFAHMLSDTSKQYNEIEKFSKKSLAIVSELIQNPVREPFVSPSQSKIKNQIIYDRYADIYAWALYREGKFEEALKFALPLIQKTKYFEGELFEHNVLILGAAGQYKKAKELAEIEIKSGVISTKIRVELKKDFVKINGNDDGYEKYFADLVKNSENKNNQNKP